MNYSFVIPVYNRPDEIDELLESISLFSTSIPFEVLIIEDGSTLPCSDVVEKYRDKINVHYYFKANSGPGKSRNYGMQKAKGDYFIILDSDCILPPHYLSAVDRFLSQNYVDCFGGQDAAHQSFSDTQKAINSVMTSVFTTGGIRGATEKIEKFQPRSFNMGLSKKAFQVTGGFGNMHPGEDPELTMKLWDLGFETALIQDAFVYHKRRINWKKFYIQVYKFGKARPILNHKFPKYKKTIFWLPSLYIIGTLFSIIAFITNISSLFFAVLLLFNLLVFCESILKNRSIYIGILSIVALQIQYLGYGWGFLKSTYYIEIQKKKPIEAMPEMFFLDEKK